MSYPDPTHFWTCLHRRRTAVLPYCRTAVLQDARDVLLTQGGQECPGACRRLFDGQPCFACHVKELADRPNAHNVSYALDMGNAT